MSKRVRRIVTAILTVMLVVSVGMLARGFGESRRQLEATEDALRLARLPDFGSSDALVATWNVGAVGGASGDGDGAASGDGALGADLGSSDGAGSNGDASGDGDAVGKGDGVGEALGASQKGETGLGVKLSDLTPKEREKLYLDALSAMDIEALRKVNADVCGWLVIPGTRVSYPVVRGADNDFYLDRNWKGEKNSAGAVFVDSRVGEPFDGQNTVVYGHNMNDGQMFAALKGYRDAAFLAEHPRVYFADGERVRVYEVFSAREASVEDYDGSPYATEFAGDAAKRALIDDALKNSVVDCGVTPTVEDRILTLSTCVAEGRGYGTRWVVMAAEADTQQK